MKRVYQQIIFSILGLLICVSLSGCTIGGYHVLDGYEDENSEQHFMIFGTTGPSGGEESIENENSAEAVDDVQESDHLIEAVDDVQESGHLIEEVNGMQENESNNNLESIAGASLKKGWTSSDNSILKGRDVSVKEDDILFSINFGQEKEVIISYDIVLDKGEYQLVYTSPDGTEQILQDGKVIQSEEKILFTQGQNEISILSNNAVFKEIDISITGIEISDF